jgi:DNA polymerase-3 subunit gamma/tau
VREALGLINDDLYAEVLGLVAERRPEAVFPFVARLVEAGADLAEFTAGLGETLRAALLRVLGAGTEGLTDAMRAAVERYAPTLREGDLLRMLKLLADTETAIRRSGNARLYLETLLLQWTLLDRTVELEEVIEALARGGQGQEGQQEAPPRQQRPERSDPSPTPAPAPRAAGSKEGEPSGPRPGGPAAPPPTRPLSGSGLTSESLAAWWPAVVDVVGQRRRMLREALARSTPILGPDGTVILEFPDADVHREGVEQGRSVVEGAISQVMGAVARLVIRSPSGQADPSEAREPEPRRLDRQADREERLRTFRGKDPALDAAVDALGLELTE